MIVLAIDTCEQNAIIELNKKGELFTEILEKSESTSENLLLKIENLLNKTNTSISDINLIGVCTGPGSFTGIRIAISVVKGLACGLKNIKLVAVNSFEKIAYKNNINKNAIIVLPSSNKDIYYSDLEINENNSVFFKDYGFKEAGDIVKLAQEKNCKIYALKEHEEELKKYFTQKNEVSYLEENNISFTEVVQKKLSLNGFTDINSITPLYIKQSQAERELKSLVKEKSEIKKPIMVQDLVDIENECFTQNKFSEKMFLEELNSSTRDYYVMYYKGKPIAYMGLMIIENELNLLKIAVIPEFRKLGLAQKLMNVALNIKKEKNLDVFYLEVNSKNEPAIKLYEKLGFKTKHERKNYYQNGDSCLVMFYEL